MNNKLFWRCLGCFVLFVILFPLFFTPLARPYMDLPTTGVSDCSDIQKWGYAALMPLILGILSFLNIVLFYRKELSE